MLTPAYAIVTSMTLEKSFYTEDENITFIGTQNGTDTVFVIIRDSNGNFENKLYINQGNFIFTEEAKKYGLADANRGTQATFFDYDNDNDLDVYIANTPDIESKNKIINLSKVPTNKNTLLFVLFFLSLVWV